MTKIDQIRTTAHGHICDALELKKVASAASLTNGARRMGGLVRRELRSRAACLLREARKLDALFARSVYARHRASEI